MAGVEEASTAAVVCTLAAEAVLAGVRIRHLPPVTEVHLLRPLPPRVQVVSTQRGRVTAILDPAVISRAGVNGMEILPRHLLLPLMANGIPLAAQLEAVDLRARNRRLGPQV